LGVPSVGRRLVVHHAFDDEGDSDARPPLVEIVAAQANGDDVDGKREGACSDKRLSEPCEHRQVSVKRDLL
jgi:hypothetical protein